MADVELPRVDEYVVNHTKLPQLIEAAASIANAIHAGLAFGIQGSLMEKELRDALGLKPGELVRIPRR